MLVAPSSIISIILLLISGVSSSLIVIHSSAHQVIFNRPTTDVRVASFLSLARSHHYFCHCRFHDFTHPSFVAKKKKIKKTMMASSSSSSPLSEPPSGSDYRNHLATVTSLNNQFFALRHGQSLANVAGVIASNPDVACMSYGLSEVGKQQAEAAGLTVVETYQKAVAEAEAAAGTTTSSSSSLAPKGIVIVTSDLLRAKETAQIVANAVRASSSPIPLYKDSIVIDRCLRERGFGTWDGGSDVHYNDVWKDDAIDPSHTNEDVESVLSVTDRATRCIMEWDDINNNTLGSSNWMVVCVAHGDVLQILQTAFSKMDPAKHRSLQHLETATLRPLTLSATSS